MESVPQLLIARRFPADSRRFPAISGRFPARLAESRRNSARCKRLLIFPPKIGALSNEAAMLDHVRRLSLSLSISLSLGLHCIALKFTEDD